jgi:hypothetical protein
MKIKNEPIPLSKPTHNLPDLLDDVFVLTPSLIKWPNEDVPRKRLFRVRILIDDSS